VEIDGVGLASILAANREALVRNNMVEEGNTRDQAETHIDLILMVLRRISRAKLDVGGSAGRTAATLELRLNLP